MKVCQNCSRVNRDEVEECIGCGVTEFEELLVAPYNSIEAYWDDWAKEHIGKEEDNGSDRNT